MDLPWYTHSFFVGFSDQTVHGVGQPQAAKFMYKSIFRYFILSIVKVPNSLLTKKGCLFVGLVLATHLAEFWSQIFSSRLMYRPLNLQYLLSSCLTCLVRGCCLNNHSVVLCFSFLEATVELLVTTHKKCGNSALGLNTKLLIIISIPMEPCP